MCPASLFFSENASVYIVPPIVKKNVSLPHHLLIPFLFIHLSISYPHLTLSYHLLILPHFSIYQPLRTLSHLFLLLIPPLFSHFSPYSNLTILILPIPPLFFHFSLLLTLTTTSSTPSPYLSHPPSPHHLSGTPVWTIHML